EAVVCREAREHLEVELVAPVPAADRARGEAQVGELHHPPRIEELDHAQAVAFGAGARRIVEGEKTRLELGERMVAYGTGEARGEQVPLAAVHVHRDGAPVAEPQRGLEGF